jgi:hypothetical protein
MWSYYLCHCRRCAYNKNGFSEMFGYADRSDRIRGNLFWQGMSPIGFAILHVLVSSMVTSSIVIWYITTWSSVKYSIVIWCTVIYCIIIWSTVLYSIFIWSTVLYSIAICFFCRALCYYSEEKTFPSFIFPLVFSLLLLSFHFYSWLNGNLQCAISSKNNYFLQHTSV